MLSKCSFSFAAYFQQCRGHSLQRLSLRIMHMVSVRANVFKMFANKLQLW